MEKMRVVVNFFIVLVLCAKLEDYLKFNLYPGRLFLQYFDLLRFLFFNSLVSQACFLLSFQRMPKNCATVPLHEKKRK